jgi:hypothetical protein
MYLVQDARGDKFHGGKGGKASIAVAFASNHVLAKPVH